MATLEEKIVRCVLLRVADWQSRGDYGRRELRQELVDLVGSIIRDSPGVKALRGALQRMRWDDQGGYPGRHDGRWTFTSTGLSQIASADLDRMFALAGVVPDEIFSLGSCDECANAKVHDDGTRTERGYAGACSPCKRPRMSNFVPLHKLSERKQR